MPKYNYPSIRQLTWNDLLERLRGLSPQLLNQTAVVEVDSIDGRKETLDVSDFLDKGEERITLDEEMMLRVVY